MTKANRSISKARQTQGKSSKLALFIVLGGAVILGIAEFVVLRQKPALVTAQVSGGPRLTTDKELVDLGDIRLGNPVQVSFELKNSGDQPLQFSEAPYIEVKEGC